MTAVKSISLLRVLLPLVLLAATAACDPCSGVAGCFDGARIAYRGTMVRHFLRTPVPGVRLEFRRTGGVRLASDTLVTVTDAKGTFHLDIPANAEGTVVGDMLVTPPDTTPPYTITGLSLTTVQARGDARLLEPWVVDPYEDLQWELIRRSTRVPLRGDTVYFVQTSGVPLRQQPYRVMTDEAGRFRLHVSANAFGTFKGDLRVGRADSATLVVRNIEVATIYTQRDSRYVGPMFVGSWLGYYGVLVWANDGAPAAGVSVTFRRTGGIGVTPSEFTVTTTSEGRFPIQPVPASDGTLIAEISVRTTPTGAPTVISGIQVPTFDSDEYRQLGKWTIPRP